MELVIPALNWQSFLVSALSTPDHWLELLKQYVTASGLDQWPGNQGASEHQLTAVEAKLQITLPPSYRAFLKATDGWRFASVATPELRSVEKIRWFRKEHKDWYDAYQMTAEPLSVAETEYFDYTKQDCADFEIKHLAQSLCVSEIGDDAVVLLNPMVVWPDGEWETWYFSNSSPGATRYRSFAGWMREELDQPPEQTPTADELPVVYLDPPSKPDRRIRRREKPLVLEKVLKKLKSEKEEDRAKAADQLGSIGGRQAVEALIGALKDPVNYVYWSAAVSLGKLCAPEALDALIEASAEGDMNYANEDAIGALAGYRDERSAQLLLRILEKGGYYSSQAAHVLAKRGDVRAIKYLTQWLMLPLPLANPGGPRPSVDDELKRSLSDERNSRVEEISKYAGQMISEFGDAGFAALEPVMNHPDKTMRERALRGISSLASVPPDKILRRKAYELLKRCQETEPDAGLRREIEFNLEYSAKKNR